MYPYVEGLTTIAFPNVGLDPSGTRVAVYAKDRPDLPLDHVDAGFGFFGPEVLDLLPEGRSSFEAALFPRLALEGRLGARSGHQAFGVPTSTPGRQAAPNAVNGISGLCNCG